MKVLAGYSVRKPVTVLMSILIVILLGVVSLSKLSLELIPDINLPFAVVVTTYEGANPEEVEADVTIPVEQSMMAISNFKNITSTSNEHFSIVFVEFEQSTNMDTAFLEMRESLDRLDLKDGIKNPMIIKFDPSMMPVMAISLSKDWGLDDEQSLIKTTEWINSDVLKRLEKIPGVASVAVQGGSDTVMQIDLDDDKLEDYGLTQDEVLRIIEDQNIEGLAGIVPDEENIRMLYIGNKIDGLDELKSLPITYESDTSKVVTLDDIATSIGFKNSAENQYTKINGQQGIMMSFQKQSGEDITTVVNAIQKELNDITKEYDAEYVELLNQGDYIQEAVGSVTNNLLIGAALAIIVLFLFLKDIRPTLIVGLAIPISVIGAFTLMYFSGITLNMISMGGLALGIGMLVDNSIVVIENIYRLLKEGKTRKEAAIYGASQVAGAITASTLTTITVFLPIVFIENLIAEMFTSMALTVTFSLLASLVIALSMVPSISARVLKEGQANTEGKVISKLKSWYIHSVKYALNNKFKTLFATFLLLGFSIYLGQLNGMELMPQTDEGSISINIEMQKGTQFEQTAALTDEFLKEITAIPEVDTTSAQIGSSGMMAFFGGGMGSNDTASITVLLSDNRSRSTNEVVAEIEKIRNKLDDDVTKDIYDISVSAQNSTGMSGMGGNGIAINVKGDNLKEMRKISNKIVEIIKEVEGTKDWDNGIAQTDQVIWIEVNKEEAIKHGLTETDIKTAIDIFYKSFGFGMSIEEDTSIKVKIEGIDYEITVPSSGFGGFNKTFDEFLSMIRVFDYDVSKAVLNKLNENDTTFMLYYINVPFFDEEMTIENKLFDPSKPVGTLLLNPMIRYNEVEGKVYIPEMEDMLTDTNPTLTSLSPTTVYDDNTDITNIESVPGFSSISRDGKTRQFTVTAGIVNGYNIKKVGNEVEKRVNKYLESEDFIYIYGNKGYSVEIGGENQEIKDIMVDMAIACSVAILLVYMVMAIQFQSLKYPFIVMFTIPLAFTGGLLAVFLTGQTISMVSMVGLIVLSGIVVNNGIVLIDYINQLREKGLSTYDAVIEAGQTRLRPILMTALTTSLALLSMAIGIGEGSETLQPLAITAIGGLIYATILTLVIVPVMYSILSRKDNYTVQSSLKINEETHAE